VTVRRLVAIALCVAAALPLRAQPMAAAVAGHWRSDAASAAAGGTLAPMPLLGEARAHTPTSLPLRPTGEVALEVGHTVPFTYVQGRRYFVELTQDSREARATVPLAADPADARWWLGWSATDTHAFLYHRDRWLDDRAQADGTGTTLALAWKSGGWTLGAARHDADLSGLATGQNLADILGVRRGHERAEFAWDGRADTFGAQYDCEAWTGGLQLSERDDSAHVLTEISGSPFSGLFATDTRTLDAWVARGPADERYFAYVTRSEIDPAPSAIASGDAIRGRTSLSGESTVIGIGRRRTGERPTEHIELSWIEHSLDFSGRFSDGVLGSVDGQMTAQAHAGASTIAARYGQTRSLGAWRYTLAASAMHTDLRFHARAVDSPGPFLAPDWEWEERLTGGEGWVGSLALGVGREVDGWQIDALYTLLGGDTWGHFRDMTEAGEASTAARIPPAPDTGPSPHLDLGWTFAVQVSREL